MQNNMDIQIQQLCPDDISSAEDLAHIMIAAWRSGFRDILPEDTIEKYTQFEPCTQMFRQLLASGAGSLLLARMDSQPVGLLYWLPEEESARIEALLTVPEVWGKGVASALMERALKDASSYKKITVWPFLQNHRARRFYEKHNFSPTGRTRMGDAPETEYSHFICNL